MSVGRGRRLVIWGGWIPILQSAWGCSLPATQRGAFSFPEGQLDWSTAGRLSEHRVCVPGLLWAWGVVLGSPLGRGASGRQAEV